MAAVATETGKQAREGDERTSQRGSRAPPRAPARLKTHDVGSGQPAGRLYVAREDDEIRIVDIALLRSFATAASGRRCCADCNQRRRPPASPAFALRATAGKLLRIHVERFNPALRLYERLGFQPIDDRGVYLFMEWLARRSANRQGGRKGSGVG